MDGSDGNNPTNGGPPARPPPAAPQRSHPDNSRAVRAELDARRQLLLERQRRYGPGVHEQTGRVFGDITPAWYARLRLHDAAGYATGAESTLLAATTASDRPLSDTEARAIVEMSAATADRLALSSWGFEAAALAMTWRGRRTLRFPLWTPHVAPLPRRGALVNRALWHGARFTAYLLALRIMLTHTLLAVSASYDRARLLEDPRLRTLRLAGRDGGGHAQDGVRGGGQESGGGEGGEGWNEGAQYKGSYTGEDAQQQQQQQQQQAGWETYKQKTQQQYGQSTQSQGSAGWGGSGNSGWGGPDVDDDASPVSAPNAGPSYGNNSGGSAWDRLRRGVASQQQQQQQQQEQRPSPSSSGGWGDSGDRADRAAQEKAQGEFDRLVERDRQGQGQGRSGWGGR